MSGTTGRRAAHPTEVTRPRRGPDAFPELAVVEMLDRVLAAIDPETGPITAAIRARVAAVDQAEPA